MAFDVEAVLAASPGSEASFGDISEPVSEALDAIDSELMKRGTLEADSLNWDVVLEKSAIVLESCAHLKAFRGAIMGLCLTPDGAKLRDALLLADHLFGKCWPGLHPTGGRAERLKSTWSDEIIAALAQGASYLRAAERQIPADCLDQLNALIATLDATDVSASALRKVLQEAEPAEAVPPGGASSALQTTDAGTQPDRPIANIGQAVTKRSDLTPRDRAVLRQDMRALADRITRFDPDAAIAYSMRGYAAWMELTDIPADADGKTEQQAMPAFIVDEHRSALEAPSLERLIKIEDRLFMSPDWFDGQFIAFHLASALRLKLAAEAIRTRCQLRLASFPRLIELKHSNETRYLTEELLTWLTETDQAGSSDSDDGSAVVSAPTLDQALAATEEVLQAASSPRAKAVIRLQLADRLERSNFPDLAGAIRQDVQSQLDRYAASQWDSDLYESCTAPIRS